MQNVTQIFGDKVMRFSAIKEEKGIIGAVKSHIEVMKMAIENRWNNVLILEDDAMWNKFDIGYPILKKLAAEPYDVILLGGGTTTFYPDTYKLVSSQTCTAYLLNNHYIPTLLENFEIGLQKLLDTNDRYSYSLDMYWKKLQARDNWFIVSPSLMYQMPSYSDIENKDVDYRGGMNL